MDYETQKRAHRGFPTRLSPVVGYIRVGFIIMFTYACRHRKLFCTWLCSWLKTFQRSEPACTTHYSARICHQCNAGQEIEEVFVLSPGKGESKDFRLALASSSIHQNTLQGVGTRTVYTVCHLLCKRKGKMPIHVHWIDSEKTEEFITDVYPQEARGTEADRAENGNKDFWSEALLHCSEHWDGSPIKTS